MSENKIDNAIGEIIVFLKQFFYTYILLFFNPKKVMSGEEQRVSSLSLVLLSCFIFSVTVPYLDGEFLSDLIVEPLAYFETIKQIPNTSIIQSFILSIPYFLITYVLGKVLTFLLFKKENRVYFQKLFYYYIFWMLMTRVFIFSLMAFWALIFNLDDVPVFFKYLFNLIYNDWVLYSLDFIPIINIIARFYNYNTNKYFLIPLSFFVVVLYCSQYCFTGISDFRNNIIKSNTRVHTATPVLFFSEDENNIYVEFSGSDSVLLSGQLVLSNLTDEVYYCSAKNIATITFETRKDVYENIELDIANYNLKTFKKVEANSLERFDVSKLISTKEWKLYDSLCSLNGDKAVYALRLNCEKYDFDPYEGVYSHYGMGFSGDYDTNPISINFIKK